ALRALEGFGPGDLTVTLSGSSQIQGAKIAQGRLNVSACGARIVPLGGSADSLKIEGSGASHLVLNGTTSRAADVSLSGASSAKVSVSDTLAYSLSGASTLVYVGDPTITGSETSGGSSATKGT